MISIQFEAILLLHFGGMDQSLFKVVQSIQEDSWQGKAKFILLCGGGEREGRVSIPAK